MLGRALGFVVFPLYVAGIGFVVGYGDSVWSALITFVVVFGVLAGGVACAAVALLLLAPGDGGES